MPFEFDYTSQFESRRYVALFILCHNIVRDSLIDRHIWKNVVQMRPSDSGRSTMATGGILNIYDTAEPRIPYLIHQKFLFSYN